MERQISAGTRQKVGDYMDKLIGDVHLPVAERLANEVLSLHVHTSLSQADLNTIVAEVNKL